MRQAEKSGGVKPSWDSTWKGRPDHGDLVSADFGTGNPVWLVVLGLLAAAAVATRMRRLTDDAVAVPEEPCEGES